MKKLRDWVRSSYFVRLLLSFSLSSVAILTIFSLVSYSLFTGISRSNMRSESQRYAEEAAAAIESTLAQYHTVLRTLHESAEVNSFLTGRNSEDLKLEILRQMYALKNGIAVQATLTVVRVGQPEAVTTGADNPQLLRPSSLNWGAFRLANAENGIVVRTTAKDPTLGADTRVCLVQAVRPEGSDVPDGYLMVEISRTALESLLQEYMTPYGTAMLVINQNSTVLYHSAGSASEGLGKLSDRGSAESAWENDEKGFLWNGSYAYCRADSAGVLVLTEIPSHLVSQLRQVLSAAALIALGFGIPVSFLLSYFMAGSVSRPIRRLKNSMAKVQSGDLTAKVAVSGPDEIGQLGEAFNEMTDRIAELVHHVEEKQESLRVAEAKALSLQVNPHFIYNTLELIRWSAKLNRTDVVVNITVNFGKLLRRILNNRDDLVTVEYELELVKAYTEIQKSRYADRLQVKWDVDEALLGEKMPKLLLQPLVENAIVHGLENKLGVGCITITGRGEAAYLRFTVSDNGVGMSSETLDEVRRMKDNGMFRIGLLNVHERAVVYGDEHCGLHIESAVDEGTTITLITKRQLAVPNRPTPVNALVPENGPIPMDATAPEKGPEPENPATLSDKPTPEKGPVPGEVASARAKEANDVHCDAH